MLMVVRLVSGRIQMIVCQRKTAAAFMMRLRSISARAVLLLFGFSVCGESLSLWSGDAGDFLLLCADLHLYTYLRIGLIFAQGLMLYLACLLMHMFL